MTDSMIQWLSDGFNNSPFDFADFWIPSALMGGGIAIDVTIATLAMFMMAGLSVRTWTIPITLTHVIFPAFGYYIFWGLSVSFPSFAVVLGLIGFMLVALFVYEVICESADIEPVFGISAWLGDRIGLKEDDSRLIIKILAVSWDALWSGPAKAAQADAGNWTEVEVILSFLVAGLVVALIAQAALGVAYLLRRIRFSNASALAKFTFWSKWVELSVIGGFGVLALWNGLSGSGNLYASIAIAAFALLIVFVTMYRKLMDNELEEAEEAIKGEGTVAVSAVA